MELAIRRDERGYLEVKETIMSFTDTKVQYWYYDTDNWLRTLHGREGDEPVFPMIGVEIAWVQKYYIPKVASW